jgi:hypothetical protein
LDNERRVREAERSLEEQVKLHSGVWEREISLIQCEVVQEVVGDGGHQIEREFENC